jgi:tetratricopeptide (TPR) repeat protein
LLEAIEKYPNEPDLFGFLGYAYRRMGRIVDARKQFETAWKRKGKSAETYLQWVKMEIAEKEWSKAIAATDKALKLMPNLYELSERRAYAKRQAGFDFLRGLHRENAKRYWRDAVRDVENSIKSAESLEPGEQQVSSSMFCTIVICLDMLEEFYERDKWLARWEKEHPNDPQLVRQKEILISKHGWI